MRPIDSAPKSEVSKDRTEYEFKAIQRRRIQAEFTRSVRIYVFF